MAAIYHHAIVFLGNGRKAKYRAITQPGKFVDYCKRALAAEKIFFYRLNSRTDKSGTYDGYWHPATGLVLPAPIKPKYARAF